MFKVIFVTDKQYWFSAFILLTAICFIYVLYPILTPFLASFIIAYLGNPIVKKLIKVNLSRTLAVCIVFSIAILLSLLILFILIPGLLHQFKIIIQLLPQWGAWLQENIFPLITRYMDFDPDFFNWKEFSTRLGSEWSSTKAILSKISYSISASTFALINFFINLFLIPVVTFYLLRDLPAIKNNIKALFPRNVEPAVTNIVRECDTVLGAFLQGQMMVMFWLGMIYGIGLWLVGLQFAMLIGFIAGLASIIPYMGFVVGIGIALLTAFFQFDSWLPITLVVGVFTIGQIIESVLLTPWLVGNKVGLHPVMVIFAIMAGGHLFGFTGILLALPIGAIIMVLLTHLHENYKNSGLYSLTLQKKEID